MYDADLLGDLVAGRMLPKELIDGIIAYNKKDAEKIEADRNPLTVVYLRDDNDKKLSCTLPVEQMARAEGITFVTDEAGAKEAKKDNKRFTVREYKFESGIKLQCVFVVLCGGALSERQKEIFYNAGLNNAFVDASFGMTNDDGDLVRAKITIPKDVTDVLGEGKIFEEINGFLEGNTECQTEIQMYYGDEAALTNELLRFYPNDLERLTIKFQNPLPKGFEKKFDDEMPLSGIGIVVKDNNTVSFKVTRSKEADVQAYFNTREFVKITPWFANNYGVDGVMKFALKRTSNKPLTLDISYCGEDDIDNNLPGILAKISEKKNANGLNLTIRFTSKNGWNSPAEKEADYVLKEANGKLEDLKLPEDTKHLFKESEPNDVYSIRFETEPETFGRKEGVWAGKMGILNVSEKLKEDIKDGTIDSSGLVKKIKQYNKVFPEKINSLDTNVLVLDLPNAEPGKDIITFSLNDIKSLPPRFVLFLNDATRLKELQDADLRVEIQNEGRPDEYLIVLNELTEAGKNKEKNKESFQKAKASLEDKDGLEKDDKGPGDDSKPRMDEQKWHDRPHLDPLDEKPAGKLGVGVGNIQNQDEERIREQMEACLKVIKKVILDFEPKVLKGSPKDIEKEPNTAENENIQTYFKRMLLGYYKDRGLSSTVKNEKTRGLSYTGDAFDMLNDLPAGAKALLEDKGAAFQKELLERITPVLNNKEKEQAVRTKTFASHVWKQIVYYVQEGKFPDTPLIDPVSELYGICRNDQNFLRNKGNGDCGPISILQGMALLGNPYKVKVKDPDEEYTDIQISNFRTTVAAKIISFDRKGRQKDDGNYLNFLPEDAEKWDACAEGIKALKSKGDANIFGEEKEQLAVMEKRLKELEGKFSTKAIENRIKGEGTASDKTLLPDDFRLFAKDNKKTILLVEEGDKEPVIHLYFRDGTQYSNGMEFFKCKFDPEMFGQIVCIRRKACATDADKKGLAHYEAFSAKGRKALWDALGGWDDGIVERWKKTFSGKDLDLATRSNPEKLLQKEEEKEEEEDRMTARITFETSAKFLIERCFEYDLASVTLPSYETYKEQQTNALKECLNDIRKAVKDGRRINANITTKLKWVPSLEKRELEELNGAFEKDDRHLVQYGADFKFETLTQYLERWKDSKLYDGVTFKEGVLDFSKDAHLLKNLQNANRSAEYFYDLLAKYIPEGEKTYKYNGADVKTIKVNGLEDLIFEKLASVFTLEEYVKKHPEITFQVSPKYCPQKTKFMSITEKESDGIKYLYCTASTDEEKEAWDETYLPWLKDGHRPYEETVVGYYGVNFKEKGTKLMLQMYKNDPKDFVSCLTEKMHRGDTVDFSGLTSPKFESYFQTKNDMQFLSCLKEAKLWIPKSCMENFDNPNLFKTDWKEEKKDSGQTFVLVSVLPQPSRIQFVKDRFETKNGLKWEGTRLVWNLYAKYLYDYAKKLLEDKKGPMGCEIFADRIAEAAKAQGCTNVYVDLNCCDHYNYDEAVIQELWMRGINVLFDLNKTNREKILKLRKDGKTVRGMYRRNGGDYNVWLLSGADLEKDGTYKQIAEDKEKTLLAKKKELLETIQKSTANNIDIPKELLYRATVKEIFDAIEKNPNKGTVTFAWERFHCLNGDLSAWARTYCSSKETDKRPLMNRIIKFIPEKEDDIRHFPGDDVAEYAMAGDEQGAFGCISDDKKDTLTFCTFKNFVAAKREKLLTQIAWDYNKDFVIDTPYEWAATGFGYAFSPLIEAKMKPGRAGNFILKINSRAEGILNQIEEYVSTPRNERSKDLVFTFDKGAKIRKVDFDDWLKNRDEELKARILYTFGKDDRKDEVTSITLRSRFTYLSETVGKKHSLALRKEDIVASSETTDSNFENLMKKVASNSLKNLSVSGDVLSDEAKKKKNIFLKGLSPLFDGNGKKGEKTISDWVVVKVTSDSEKVIDELLNKYGNKTKDRFCIKPDGDDTGKTCLILSHKEFEDLQKKKLIDEIGKNKDDKTFDFSTTNGTYNTLDGLWQLLNKKDTKGNLEVTGFDKDAASTITKYILEAGVKRSWYMVFKNCEGFSLENLIGKMGNENGWALDCTPGENEATIKFFPANAEKTVSEEIWRMSKNLFKKKTGSHTVCPGYWKIDAVAVLRAAEDPESKVTEVVFDGVRDNKHTSKNLLSQIATFCKDEGVPNRRTNWKLMINFGTGKESASFRSNLRNYRI